MNNEWKLGSTLFVKDSFNYLMSIRETKQVLIPRFAKCFAKNMRYSSKN